MDGPECVKLATTLEGFVDTARYLQFNVLPKSIVDGPYKKRKSWTQNRRRRFQIIHGKLQRRTVRIDYKKKSVPGRLRAKLNTWVTVPDNEEHADQIVLDDHNLHHDGHDKIEERVQRQWAIPHLRDRVLSVRRACQICSEWAPAEKHVSTPIYTTQKMELVMFDLTTMPMETPEGFKHIVFIIDHFTKYLWGKAFVSREAVPIADFIFQVLSKEGCPDRWHTDNGTDVCGTAFEMARDRLDKEGIDMSTGMPRNPRCQGTLTPGCTQYTY